MTPETLDALIQKLSWNVSPEEVARATQALQQIDDEHLAKLVMPSSDKSLWNNAALVLTQIGYPRIESNYTAPFRMATG